MSMSKQSQRKASVSRAPAQDEHRCESTYLGCDGDDGTDLLNAPLTFIIFGGSGDLAHKKLYPALFYLFMHGFIPQHTSIVAFARSKYDINKHRNEVRDSIKKSIDSDTKRQISDRFIGRIEYCEGQYGIHRIH